MHSTLTSVLAFFFFFFFFLQSSILSVNASLYVINPIAGSACRGSKPCTIQWLDDGTEPLLSDIGICAVGLYTGQEDLVQTITPVDVSSSHSLTFTPDPKAGPNANTYYIAFTSTTLKNANGTGPYQGFSPAFRLTSMSGSFASPVPSDTATVPIPPALLVARSTTSSSTSVSTVHATHSSVSSSSTSNSSSSSSSGTPTTPLVFPTPTGTVSSDNRPNSALHLHTAAYSSIALCIGLTSLVALQFLLSGAVVVVV